MVHTQEEKTHWSHGRGGKKKKEQSWFGAQSPCWDQLLRGQN